MQPTWQPQQNSYADNQVYFVTWCCRTSLVWWCFSSNLIHDFTAMTHFVKLAVFREKCRFSWSMWNLSFLVNLTYFVVILSFSTLPASLPPFCPHLYKPYSNSEFSSSTISLLDSTRCSGLEMLKEVSVSMWTLEHRSVMDSQWSI